MNGSQNNGTAVEKALGPEELAIVQNVGALVQELLGGANAAPTAEPSFGDEGAAMNPGAPQIAKGSEQGTTPDEPQSIMQPGAAPAARGMAPKGDDDEVDKAFKVIAKALIQSESEGPVAQDPAEERVEDTDEDSEDNIAQVAKALRLKLLGKKGVAKSRGSADNEMLKVLKSFAARMDRQDMILGEILGGLGVEAPAPAAPSQVAKSQTGAPLTAGAIEDIVAAVAKGMSAMQPVAAISGPQVAKGFENRGIGQSSIDQYSELFAHEVGWGTRQ